MAVEGRITGLIYRLAVTQEFVNVSSEFLEATYIFPLPAWAGITRFVLRMGERLIEGVLKERAAAHADYAQALRAGHPVAIAEEERPDVFTVRAGNIPPGEAVHIALGLTGPLAFAEGQATFRFPLVVAPRYIPGFTLNGPSVGQGVAWDTNAVLDASRISPPILLPGQPNPIHLTLRLEMDSAGLPITNLHASLHELQLGQTAEGMPVVELRPGVERLDRDFILHFRVGGEQIASSFLIYRTPEGQSIGLLTVVPPKSSTVARPRDVVMVLDRSGSMEGWKIAAARRAVGRLLDSLTPQDRFGLILFDDQIEEPAPSAGQLIQATDRNRFRTIECLGRVKARGGTEMAPALERALQYFSTDSSDKERILLLISDGQVGNEDQLLRSLQPQAQHCRIFTMGIDQAVNASFLERLARYGGGHCELVESEARLDEALRTVHRRLNGPVLTRLRFKPALQAVAPQETDMFPGIPLRLAGCWPDSQALPTQMIVTAQQADGQPFQFVVQAMETKDSAIYTVWARAYILDLEYQLLVSHDRSLSAETITTFSLRHGILCHFTTWVAVDCMEPVNHGGELCQIVQAVDLPAGSAYQLRSRPDHSFGSNDLECLDTLASLQTESDDCDALIRELALMYSLRDPSFDDDLKYFEMPAFLRRCCDDCDAASPFTVSRPTSHTRAVLVPWFKTLRHVLISREADLTQKTHAIRVALRVLEDFGDETRALVQQGCALMQQLDQENSHLDMEAYLGLIREWLHSMQQWLKSLPPDSDRRLWWINH